MLPDVVVVVVVVTAIAVVVPFFSHEQLSKIDRTVGSLDSAAAWLVTSEVKSRGLFQKPQWGYMKVKNGKKKNDELFVMNIKFNNTHARSDLRDSFFF